MIEVACGEYGSHVQTLVKAIQNGKHDVQDDKPFPEQVELLNNAIVKSQNGNYSLSRGLQGNLPALLT